ncbi:S8 family peptidase [Actinophytocola sediminis]
MRRSRSSVALLLAGVVLLADAGHAAATPPAPPPTPEVAPSPAAAEFVPGPTFTLLTGDQVRLDTAADGRQQGALVLDAGPQDDIRFTEVEDDLYALPIAAVRLVGEGRLDRELFNLTKLAEYGYDDAHLDELPVIVTYPPARAETARAPRGSTKTRTLSAIDATTLAVAKDHAPAAWAELTSPAASVRKVWLDGKAQASLDVSVPAIGAPQAWQAGLDGTGVKVAVLDTGVDATHPDLAGRIAASRSFVAGQDVADLHGHGTHVAAIALGAGGQYTGVAPGAQLVVGKVLDNEGSGLDSEIIAGMEWAAAQGAKVINMSLGSGPTDGTDPMAQAVNRISEDTGALFVIAAGNDERPETVSSPGTADRALTVGAVDKTAPHSVAWYSSRGPRILDRAVKPEITAPGTGIVAARTGGGHVSQQGTSMASPHVAGAAAILAQQHPNWTATQLKDALVSTANPNPAEGVTEQGGGMVDLSRATAAAVVATGTLNLGAIEPPYAATSGTVTFQNVSAAPVRADLALTLRTGLTANADYTPPPGAVTIEPSTVDIPAGGSVPVRVSVDIAALDIAPYFGWLEARSGDTVLARSTVGWSKEIQRHRLTLKGVDRLGVPANTVDCSLVHILNLETGEQIEGWWQDGRAYTWRYGGPDPLLPEGRYGVLANVCTYTLAAPYFTLSDTIGGAAELVLDRDREIVIDARTARKLEYRTERSAEPLGHHDHLVWAVRQVTVEHEDGAISHPTIRVTSSAREQYVVPDDSTATIGTFFLHFSSYLVAPALTMRASGNRVPELHPWYPNENSGQTGCAGRVLCHPTFDSGKKYSLVYAGGGSPAELASARVRGRLVVVTEDWGVPGTWLPGGPRVDKVAADAAAAGATGVLIAAGYPGSHLRTQLAPTTIPVATLSVDEGRKLADAVRRGPVSVRTGGQPVTPYAYDLKYQFDRLRLPDSRVRDRDLETVNARYHSDVPGSVGVSGTNDNSQKLAFAYNTTKFTTPHTRTEYHTPSTPSGIGPVHRYRFVVGSRTVYEETRRAHVAGARVTENYGSVPVAHGPVEHPVMTATIGEPDQKVVYPTGGELYRAPEGQVLGWPNTRNTARLLHDGKVLCDWPERINVGCATPMGAGKYRYEWDVEQNVRAFMTEVHTAWDVNVKFDGAVGAKEIVPLADLRYDVDVDLTNAVTEGKPYTATFTPGYQPGYDGHNGRFTVQAWVSHDDGRTWRSAGTEQSRKDEGAKFRLRAPRDAEFVTLRVKATDTAGNSVDQTITRAWKVTRRGQH